MCAPRWRWARVRPGVVFDSMGTAEALVGALEARALTAEDYANGLQYGCHVVDGLGYWMGGLSALPAGRSIGCAKSNASRWLYLHRPGKTARICRSSSQPGSCTSRTSLGSGSPHTAPWVRGAFIGLTNTHQSEDLFKAVLEGTAFELEYVRQAGEKMTGKADLNPGGGRRRDSLPRLDADQSRYLRLPHRCCR
jgi:sugar (pentulose or hexulose) kinase